MSDNKDKIDALPRIIALIGKGMTMLHIGACEEVFFIFIFFLFLLVVGRVGGREVHMARYLSKVANLIAFYKEFVICAGFYVE